MAANLLQLDTKNFQDSVAKSATPVLVDFWAPWCGPCKAIAPILEELATELNGKLTIAKVNVDDNGELAAQFGVRAIPTLLLFKGGQLVDQYVGLMDKASLKTKLAAKI
ncbi:MAG TPA: thioredoxin [Opitutaceae bacterium]|nr:thioredoxin [Opitutaceae bacterium]